MASIKRVNEDSVNRENVRSKFAKLSVHVEPVINQKRAAWREVGLPRFQNDIEGSEVLVGIKQSKVAALPFKETKKISNRIVNVASCPKGHESVSKFVAIEESKLVVVEDTGSLSHKPAVDSEFILENLHHLRSLEQKYAIQEGFLEEQETTPRMRAILVKWLIQVHARFDLDVETLHICVAIVDRYLQANKRVGRNFLQLVGSTALLVACKYEETSVPSIEDLVIMCESAFSKKHFLTMEVQIMKKMDHSFGRPTSVQFLKRYNEIAQVSDDHDSLGMFMLELVLMEYEMSHLKPSLQAAAACCLSLGILNEEVDLSMLWTPILVHYSNFKYDDLEEVVVRLAMLLSSRSSKFQYIRAKYAGSDYDSISSNPKLYGPLVRMLTAAIVTTDVASG